MEKPKLSVEDFYHQFPGLEHHSDTENYTRPEWYELMGLGTHEPIQLPQDTTPKTED